MNRWSRLCQAPERVLPGPGRQAPAGCGSRSNAAPRRRPETARLASREGCQPCYNCRVAGEPPNQSYTRRDVRRLLKITERQLRSWEKQELIEAAAEYGFVDLIALRTLAKLRKNKVPVTKIRRAIAALREKLSEVDNPLVELRLLSEGRNVRVQLGQQVMEPVSGQLLLDFGEEELRKLVSFPGPEAGKATARKREKTRAEAESLFQEALALEQRGATEEAIKVYRRVVEVDAQFAGAFVNLGTIYFTARDLKGAEKCYKSAIEADPQYPLAYFNLGNLYDEFGDRASALMQYQSALKLNPNYSDAHYNIALLFQATGQVLKAVHHWKAYLKLDPGSPWAAIAQRELDRIYRETVVESKKKI